MSAPVVLVSGGNRGIGFEACRALAARGARVLLGARRFSDGADAAKRLAKSGEIVPIGLDVDDPKSVSAANARIEDEFGALDVLVNNAGAAHFGILEAFSVPAVERQFATNVFGPLRVNRAFLPAMRARKSGLVVYVSSIVGRLIFPFGGVYASSKWALEALAQASSYELAPFNIDVAIVQPGAYPTEIFGKISSADDTERVASYGDVMKYNDQINALLGNLSQGRDPGDVARAVVALANAPAGTRPLRTTVPADEATDAINAAVEPIQTGLIEAIGLGDLLPKAAV